MLINIPNDKLEWLASKHTKGWEFAKLSGTHDKPFKGPFTVRCRCGPGIKYDVWVSDDIVEYVTISGVLTVNGVDLHPADYGRVESGVDGFLSSEKGMDALCTVHGKVIWGEEVLRAIRDSSLTSEDAKKLLRLPWIDHLRRHTGLDEIDLIYDTILGQTSDSIKELAISIARNLESDKLINAVQNVIQKPADLSMRVSGVLFLASKRHLKPEDWNKQLSIMKENPEELLKVTRSFYAADNNTALKDAVEKRISSGEYEYNRPFYDALLALLK